MLSFCTLFDENYIDKGLVLYHSLERVSNNFILYILCMSDRCYEILSDLNYSHLRPISLKDFENEELLRVKRTRSVAEYCWTCSSSFTKYVMETFNPEYCSYIDADMRFYADPQIIIDEMNIRNASVSIVGHRFRKSVAKEREFKVGKYCVECNTFKNDKSGKEVLDKWANQCLEYCSADGDGVHWADQKYMDTWPEEFPCVIETNNLGAGVAPWNISQYKLISNDKDSIIIKCKGDIYQLLFYHFAGITYYDSYNAKINIYNQWGIQDKFASLIYDQYLSEIDFYKRILKDKYGITNILKKHPGLSEEKRSTFNARLRHIVSSLFSMNFKRYLKDIPTILYRKKDVRKIKAIDNL